MLNKHNRYVKRVYIVCALRRSYFPYLVHLKDLQMFRQNSLVCSNRAWDWTRTTVKRNWNNLKMYLYCATLYFYHFMKKKSDVQYFVLMSAIHRSFSLYLLVQKNKWFTAVLFTLAFSFFITMHIFIEYFVKIKKKIRNYLLRI